MTGSIESRPTPNSFLASAAGDAFLSHLPKLASHTGARPALWQRGLNADRWTYPLLASVIPPFEVQDELLPHRLVSEKRQETQGGRMRTDRRPRLRAVKTEGLT